MAAVNLVPGARKNRIIVVVWYIFGTDNADARVSEEKAVLSTAGAVLLLFWSGSGLAFFSLLVLVC